MKQKPRKVQDDRFLKRVSLLERRRQEQLRAAILSDIVFILA
jgi:hypothetical protein